MFNAARRFDSVGPATCCRWIKTEFDDVLRAFAMGFHVRFISPSWSPAVALNRGGAVGIVDAEADDLVSIPALVITVSSLPATLST